MQPQSPCSPLSTSLVLAPNDWNILDTSVYVAHRRNGGPVPETHEIMCIRWARWDSTESSQLPIDDYRIHSINRYSRKVTSASNVITRRNAISLDSDTRGSRALTWEIVLESNWLFKALLEELLKAYLSSVHPLKPRSTMNQMSKKNIWLQISLYIRSTTHTVFHPSLLYSYRTSLQWGQPIDLLLCTQLAPPAETTPEDTRASDWKLTFILHSVYFSCMDCSSHNRRCLSACFNIWISQIIKRSPSNISVSPIIQIRYTCSGLIFVAIFSHVNACHTNLF